MDALAAPSLQARVMDQGLPSRAGRMNVPL
jgi:hypothetical protein